MKALYTGFFEPKEDGTYAVHVPDMPSCITSGRDLPEALRMAEDCLNELLIVMEDDGDPIPQPTDFKDIDALDIPYAIPALIRVDTEYYRRLDESRAVRKNISLPAWMAARIDSMDLNLSQFVQDALMSKFAWTRN